jgi:hypothetical protein
MQVLKAHVQSGRITLDEPTDLPDGDIYLVPADALDDLDEEERAALHETLAESVEQMKAGKLIDADEALAKLRAHR